jgi:hypothetical protein
MLVYLQTKKAAQLIPNRFYINKGFFILSPRVLSKCGLWAFRADYWQVYIPISHQFQFSLVPAEYRKLV